MSGSLARANSALESVLSTTPRLGSKGSSSNNTHSPRSVMGPRTEVFYVLRVAIVSARNLANTDVFQKASDPFVECRVVGQPELKFQTHVIKATANPKWDYEVKVHGFHNGSGLRFVVWDKDIITANDELGSADLPKEKLFPAGFAGEVLLRDPKKTASHFHSHARLTVRVCILRVFVADPRTVQPHVTVMAMQDQRESPAAAKLTLTIVSARDLRNADVGLAVGNRSDPYVICEIVGKPQSKIKTTVVHDQLCPVWEETFQMREYEIGDALSFVVWDRDFGKQDDCLGHCMLTKAQIWPRGFDGELRLEDAGAGIEAFLRVKVQVEDKQALVQAPTPAAPANPRPMPPLPLRPPPTPPAPPLGGRAASPMPMASGERRLVPGLELKKISGGEAPTKAAAPSPPPPLLEAATSGDAKAVGRLLREEVPIEAADARGRTALHLAAASGHEAVVLKLLRHKEAKRTLLERTADGRETPLHLAARKGQHAVAVILVTAGASLTAKTASGKAPADLASGQLAQWLRNREASAAPHAAAAGAPPAS